MMNLEQRLAEINRRSEKIFHKRRQRKRIALACVPLVLCMAVLAGGYLQNNERTQQESYAEAVVEVVQGCLVYEIKDTDRVAQIGQLLLSCMEMPEQEEFIYGSVSGTVDVPEIGGEAGTDRLPDSMGNYSGTGDMITVTLSDGTSYGYRLQGNLLTDQNTGRTVFLSDVIVANLRALLNE